jgi:anti-sigma factor RsiW
MNCADVDILLADYVDGTLDTTDRAEQKSALESHLSQCAACADLARDAAGAVAFMERAARIEAPPELLTRILFEVANGPGAALKPSLARRLFGKWLEPVLQPRFAMGMAMTALSFAMLGQISGARVRQLKPSDLDPVKVWTVAEDRAQRTWDRSVKYYESLRWVFEIQTQLKEWTDDQAQLSEARTPAGGALNEAQPR